MQAILYLASTVSFFIGCQAGYLITTPRKWIANENAQICINLDQKTTLTRQDAISVQLTNNFENTFKEIKRLPLVPGDRGKCYPYLLGDTSAFSLQLSITGTLAGKAVNHTHDLSVETHMARTFIQTDKLVYNPGQLVRFRMLGVVGPFLKPSTGQYEEIWIENPSGSRIAHWKNVTNEKSLLHMEFQLPSDSNEGTYNIKVRSPFDVTESWQFKVEEFVVPQFVVGIGRMPTYILATTEVFSFNVCARRNRQQVKGNLTFTLNNNRCCGHNAEHRITAEIFGCEEIQITKDMMNIFDENKNTYQLKVNAIVEEIRTGAAVAAKEVTVYIFRTHVYFEDNSVQEYMKPELPYSAEFAATFPDKSPAYNEPMRVCSGDICKDYTTDASGVLKFVVPSHLGGEIVIKAVNYPRIKEGEMTVMHASNHYKKIRKYYSPSNSSIIINLTKKLNCVPGVTEMIELPIQFLAVNQTEAYVSVQVVSRGQVQFSSTTLQRFVADPAVKPDIDAELLLAPTKNPVTVGASHGTFTLLISLPDTIAPMAKIVVWYVRDDGEVVSDVREVDVAECLPHVASLEWSVAKARPGDQASLKITALPNSICSIGVVDKSVELSAPWNQLTIKNLLDVTNEGNVGVYEATQVNNYKYCRNKEALTTQPPPIDGGIPPIALSVARRQKRSSINYPYYTEDVDAINGFHKADLFVFSDLTFETRPCKNTLKKMEDRETSIEKARKPIPQISVTEEDENYSRTSLNEILLWDLQLLETGVTEETLELPDTVTEWVGRAICVNPSKGVGLSGPSSMIITTS